MSFLPISRHPWVPEEYQVEGTKWLANKPAASLFWAPGLGKTTTVFNAFESLQRRGLAKRMLVIAPLKVCQGVWRQEADKWADFHNFQFGFAHGKNKEDILLDEDNDITLLNYDGLLWAANYIPHTNFDVLCFDELTRMKHTNTRRFKLMKPMLQYFKFRWGLTGTPIPNGYMDLFGQVFCLDGGQRLGKFITHYRFNYFHQLPFDEYNYYPNQDAPQQITKKISDLAHVVDEKKWLKLKKPKVVVKKVQLPNEARQQYEQLEREYIAKIKDNVVTAANAAVLSGKLRQFASGQVYDETREIINIHEAKLDALESLVEEMSKDPLITVVGFLHEVDAIRARLGEDTPYLGGGMSEGAVKKIIQKWNLGFIPHLLVHPTTVSAGLNLQAGGRALCWYTMTWNREERDQMLRRLLRKGQKRVVFEYHIIAEKTIDDYILEVSHGKGLTQNQFFNGLKAYFGI